MYRNFFAVLVWRPVADPSPLILLSVPHYIVGAPSFATHVSVLHTPLIPAAKGGVQEPQPSHSSLTQNVVLQTSNHHIHL
jgi:hypothetical protein